eukprot:g7963.t1
MSKEDEQLGPPIKPKSGGLDDEFPKSITLENGTELPVGLPPDVDPDQAKLALEYLKTNPVLAEQALHRADKLLQYPQMAMDLQRMQEHMSENKEYQDRMSRLREDPELKSIFDEISRDGMNAIEKYWNDMELMSKISKRMGEMEAQQNTQKKKLASIKVRDLHTAAKLDDVNALEKLIKKNHDINEQDVRGIAPLGVAVGFNKTAAVRFLLNQGADVDLVDKQGNTVLHYAAGYGRVECAELLMEAGAKLHVLNKNEQTPLDVAKINREVLMIEFLTKQSS